MLRRLYFSVLVTSLGVMLAPAPVLALAIAPPGVKYSRNSVIYNTALEAELVIYNGWIAQFGKTNCGFNQWTWTEDSTSITGYPATNDDCGGGHGPSVISKIFSCKAEYSLSTDGNECTLPAGTADPALNMGPPSEGLCIKNPCNAGTGNKYQAEQDYSTNGSL